MRPLSTYPQNHKILLCYEENFAYYVLLSIKNCGKLSTTTMKKAPGEPEAFRISDIRKRATNTIAELRIHDPYPAAPLRIWLIHTLIVSKWV